MNEELDHYINFILFIILLIILFFLIILSLAIMNNISHIFSIFPFVFVSIVTIYSMSKFMGFINKKRKKEKKKRIKKRANKMKQKRIKSSYKKSDNGKRKNNESLKQKVDIYDVDKMSGIEFESFLEILFKKRGYKVQMTQLTNDQGADLIIQRNNEKTAVQAKRYKSSVGNTAIQEVLGAKGHYNCDYGSVITNSNFTRSAKELALSNDIDLWDRKKLIKKINSTKIYENKKNNTVNNTTKKRKKYQNKDYNKKKSIERINRYIDNL